MVQAAAWASELASLSGQRGDARTALEAEAYAAWMTGTHQMERGEGWQPALSSLQRSKCVQATSDDLLCRRPGCRLLLNTLETSLSEQLALK